MMLSDTELIDKLNALNQIAETLNRAVDVSSALKSALARLVEVMGLETGWIFLHDPSAKNRWWGKGFVLAAHHNLPSGMALDKPRPWKGSCECQTLCSKGELTRAYNEVRCTRLANAGGDRRGLTVHASTALCSGDRVLGILNVAGPDWDSFTPEALALLTNVGNQMGIAVERARLYDLLQERRFNEQAALLDFSNQLLSHLDLEDLMDYLVRGVRQLLQADACALLLPGEEPDRLVFAAASGWLTEPVSKGRWVPLDDSSGPGLVMQTQQLLVAEDLQQEDPAPWMPGWLRAEGFRGHAIVPLVAEDRAIGTLVIDHREPRLLDEDDLRFLRLMANQAAIAIETARLHQEEIKRQRLEEELAVARQIQLSLLPEACPVVPGWEFCATYRAARLVGGDFYDFIDLPGEPSRLGLVIADVSGKGVPAALFMSLCRTMIRTTAFSGRNPASALMRANTLIMKDSQTRLFLSAFYANLDVVNGRLIYANAGHNWPLWFRAGSGECEELSASGIILGAFEDINLEERRIDVAPGDVLVLYTDGVTEAMTAAGQQFGQERLEAVVAGNAYADASGILDAVVDAVDAFVGDTSGAQADDFTLLIIKRKL